MEALSKQAVRILKLFGSTRRARRHDLRPRAGILPDRPQLLSVARPDLINAGRTLFGAKPPKGQELEDQYFGAIPERVLAFMSDVETELYKVGVPVKTRHNEVAPSQYEIAPVFENANVATDHQMMIDGDDAGGSAPKYGLALPAAREAVRRRQRIGQAPQLVDERRRGQQPARARATRRTTTCSSSCSARRCIRAVNKWQGLLRASIASAGNDHRLGANEAPPAIISIFLGDMLTDIFEQIEKGGAKSHQAAAATLDTGVTRAAEAAARRGRPQPHQPVRLHRQQVRVPRGVVEPEHRATRTSR